MEVKAGLGRRFMAWRIDYTLLSVLSIGFVLSNIGISPKIHWPLSEDFFGTTMLLYAIDFMIPEVRIYYLLIPATLILTSGEFLKRTPWQFFLGIQPVHIHNYTPTGINYFIVTGIMHGLGVISALFLLPWVASVFLGMERGIPERLSRSVNINRSSRSHYRLRDF